MLTRVCVWVSRGRGVEGPAGAGGSPQLVPLVCPGGEREGADLQLLDMHGQDVHGRQRGPALPGALFPRQAQVVALQENLRRRFNRWMNEERTVSSAPALTHTWTARSSSGISHALEDRCFHAWGEREEDPE